MTLGDVAYRAGEKFLKDILAFPVWWYSAGIVHTAELVARMFSVQLRNLAIGVWVRNIFVPMYGQYDWQSRLISFFMRSVQIFARSAVLFFWTLGLVLLFLAYLAAPVVFAGLLLFAFEAIVV